VSLPVAASCPELAGDWITDLFSFWPVSLTTRSTLAAGLKSTTHSARGQRDEAAFYARASFVVPVSARRPAPAA
jgi:hypothetical protein